MDDWFHVIGVVVIENEIEASQYIGLEVRLNAGNMQIRSNQPFVFNIHRSGLGRLALMNGDFERFMFIDIGGVKRGGQVSVLN
jgi:hypothetical protein